jgi:methylglutaconyl-CoA hydratase
MRKGLLLGCLRWSHSHVTSGSVGSSPYVRVTPSYKDNRHCIHVEFTRDDLHNAFNAQMIGDIAAAFRSIEGTLRDGEGEGAVGRLMEQARCVVLTGRGKTFSAGADLHWMREMADYTYDQNIQDARHLYDMIHAIRTCPIPVIARVNGSALGGGAGIVAASDIAIAVTNAKFGFTEVKLGLLPAVISPFVVAKIGAANASRYFLTGEVMSAACARDIGLVQTVSETEEGMDEEVDKIVTNICSSSPTAVRASKNLILKLTRPEDHSSEKDFVTGEIARMRVSQLGQDGLRSFLSKKKPCWISGDTPAHK